MTSHRTITARILSEAGWLQGTFQLPGHVSLVDFLDHGGAFLRLLDVTLPRLGVSQEQFALRKSSAIVVVPIPPEEELKLKVPPANAVTHRMSCLVGDGHVVGNLELLSHLRVAEHVIHHPHFFVLRDCTVAQGAAAREESFPLILLNGSRILGVTDAGGAP